MTERRSLITGQPILFAPGRAARPRAFINDPAGDRCPFCPGHESDTPPTLAAIGSPWRVRVFDNKYPPTETAEVIVESSDHDASFDSIPHADEIVAMYVDRYRVHAGAAYVTVFKNEGERAGSSIPHVHSQLVALPFVPPRIAQEGAAFAAASACPLCSTLEMHRAKRLLISESAHFAWLCPAASAFPYQQWIVPKRHIGEMKDLSADEVSDLAAFLALAARRMRGVAPAFNWGFINFPQVPAAHFYVDVFPRVTTLAGLELSTGTFVEIIDPAAAAERLRN